MNYKLIHKIITTKHLNQALKRHTYLFSYVLLFTYVVISPTSYANETKDEYPGRRLYPNIEFIDLASFHEKLAYDKLLVIDVRSTFEFETLHIKKAKNISLASPLFVAKIQELRKTDHRPIVTYCNGKTCMKSFKAAKKLIDKHIDQVMVFDAGIMDFAHSYPNEAILLGKPLKSSDKLISQSKFTEHTISPENFGKHIANSNAILLDIRDRMQRDDGISLFAGREHRVGLDSSGRLERYIAQAKQDNQGLLIYDAAGKQVRWLQYRLEESGVQNYFFMAGGANAYYQYLEKK